ncbi:cupin domain-containing protein [Arenicella xantha]|uniref:Cupin domain n=1 Tax=Arenicella xantha TaxID=644221 RepID=A0A395JKK1_9GAMM|nr:cupin domain-containing protein [Arenicella xantha]RBP49721.1 cupin domain [Arenicella xantha]
MKNQSPRFVLGASEPIEQVADGIKRQFLGYGPELMAVKVWFEEGAIGYVHDHPHTQVSYVESGEFEATIDGKTQLLKAGDSFYVAPNKSHGAVCKKAGVLIDIFSPLREDFLSEP